jgi:hypothetical protein
MIIPAIQFIYGFDYPNKPDTLHGVAEVAAIAYGYGIASLLDWAKKVADDLLAGCLDDETKLKRFLAFDRFPPMFPETTWSWRMHDCATGFVRQHLKSLRPKQAFRDLLEQNPKLTVKILFKGVLYDMV